LRHGKSTAKYREHRQKHGEKFRGLSAVAAVRKTAREFRL
jgi:hypothetical protein